MNEKEVIDALSNRTVEELYNSIGQILFRSKYQSYDTFKIKILIMEELKRRKRLVVKLTQGRGDPYLTDIKRLNGEQADAILKYCRYAKEPTECVIDILGRKIEFKQMLTA
jgi:hypothetical protein